jgi:YbgC/YbaW family acyl-CoA thioester hydrolase
MASEFTQTRIVEFAETDMAGIVHFSNYFRWMESCETAFCRSLDLPIVSFFPGQVTGWPRVNVACEFHAPFRFGDQVQVRLLVQKVGTKAITYAFRFRKVVDGQVRPEVLAKGNITAVCVTAGPNGSMVAAAIPPEVKAKFDQATDEQLAM